MKYYIILILLIIFFLEACRKQQRVKALIFERSELANNRLTIKYKYSVGDKFYFDSAIISNSVIVSDSVSIIIDPETPEKSLPEF